MAGRIFISYRRDDTPFTALALHQRLEQRFGETSVFMDVEGHISFGSSVQEVLAQKIAASDIVLVIIGPKWLETMQGRRKHADDYIHTEIETAFAHQKIVLPVFIENTPIPSPIQLPPTIRKLSEVQNARLRSEYFEEDFHSLLIEIQRKLEAPSMAPEPPKNNKLWRIPAAMLILGGSIGFGLMVSSDEDEPIPLPTHEAKHVAPVLEETPPKKPSNMVYVESGSFYFGCNDTVDDECRDNEEPGQTIKTDNYWIDKFEVSVREYNKCVQANHCTTQGLEQKIRCNWNKQGYDNHPINCVDWFQAQSYCQWQNKRLPTEVEWEKAARGPESYKYPWGNVHYMYLKGTAVANIDSNTTKSYDDKYPFTSPIGSYLAGSSPYNAMDMVGNVWEWTQSKNTSPLKHKIIKGGSWFNYPKIARASIRFKKPTSYRSSNLGFRCAMSSVER